MMFRNVGKSYTAVNTGYGNCAMSRGGEVVRPWMPADITGFSSKYTVTKRPRGGNALAKGSPEAKARMAYLRSLRGKGVRGRGVEKKDRLMHALRKRGLPVPRSLILEGKFPGLRGKGFEWDDSYTNAALRGGDIFESYTNAALAGGAGGLTDDMFEGVSELFDEGGPSSSVDISSSLPELSSIYGKILPAIKDQVVAFAAKEGQAALDYVSKPENMEGIVKKLFPKVVAGIKKIWGKLTGKKSSASDELMAMLRYLKKNDPVAYKAKIMELAETF